MKLLLATKNPGKLREQREALSGLGLELLTLDSWPALEAPDEPGPTFRDNAATKALYYSGATGAPAVGEDSGLLVDALGGRPGVESARWLGHDTPYETKNARLLELLRGIPENERRARFVSAVALAAEGRILFECEAALEGVIGLEPRGAGGFGYDPIFVHPELEKTLAQATAEEKNAVSHRGKAMAALKRYLVDGSLKGAV